MEAWVNVRDYGAIGDGVADDTDAIRAALSYVHTLTVPTVLYFPSGTYLFSGKITDPEWPDLAHWSKEAFDRTMGQCAFTITRSDVTVLGDGPEESVLSLMTRNSVGDLADPLTTWISEPNIGQGLIIFRGAAFRIGNSSKATERVVFCNLRLTGNCPATLCHDLTGTQLQATGDGWDMSHKAIIIGGRYPVKEFTVENCHIDRFRGEMVYAGGTEPTEITITESVLEECNASAFACSAICNIERTIFRNVYNGTECYAVGVGQRLTANRCHFKKTGADKPGTHGIVYEGRPSCISDAVVIGCKFDGVSRGVYLAGGCDSVRIAGCEFSSNGSGVFVGTMGNDKHFHNVEICDNTFNTPDGVAIVLNAYGLETRNVTISGNRVSSKIFLSDTCSNREGFWVENNMLLANHIYAIEASSVNRGRWSNNSYDSTDPKWTHCKSGTDRQDIVGDTGTLQPSRDWFATQIFGTGVSVAVTIPNLHLYPVGFCTSIDRFGENRRAAHLVADASWNDFASDVPLAVGVPVALRLTAERKFTQVT